VSGPYLQQLTPEDLASGNACKVFQIGTDPEDDDTSGNAPTAAAAAAAAAGGSSGSSDPSSAAAATAAAGGSSRKRKSCSSSAAAAAAAAGGGSSSKRARSSSSKKADLPQEVPSLDNILQLLTLTINQEYQSLVVHGGHYVQQWLLKLVEPSYK
jgi:hypothetical protein